MKIEVPEAVVNVVNELEAILSAINKSGYSDALSHPEKELLRCVNK